MSRYYKATEVDEFLNVVGKGNCNLCAFYDECNPVGLDGEGSHQYCWQAKRFITPDVEEVVRCKDCRLAEESNLFDGWYFCKQNRMTHQPTCFCSYGERKDTK